MGVVQFIENLDRTALTISDEEFEKNVEEAVSAIAERHKDEETLLESLARTHGSIQADCTAGNPTDSDERIRKELSVKSAPRETDDEKIAVNGLLRTIQRPLSSIGRIFSENSGSVQNLNVQQISAHPPETPRQRSPGIFQPPRDNNDLRSSAEQPDETLGSSVEDFAARQASAEAAEARMIQRTEHKDVVE